MIINIEELIKSSDLNKLKLLLDSGVSPNDKIPVKGWGEELAINCALMHRNFNAVKLLVEYGANLNDEDDPSITYAAIYGNRDMISYLVKKGANINAKARVRGSALKCAISWKNNETIYALIENNIDMEQFGGEALRYAAWHGDISIVHLLVENGADINYNRYDKVITSCSTPIQEALSGKHFDIVRYLLDKGADVTISDKWGYRPYHIASIEGDSEIIELIKNHEPKEWHDLDYYVQLLKKHCCPLYLIDFLGMKNKKIDLVNSKLTKHIEFCTIEEVRIFERDGVTFVDLVKQIENYGENGILAWLPKYMTFGSVDGEHQLVGLIKDFNWNRFVKDTDYYIDRILSWEYFEQE